MNEIETDLSDLGWRLWPDDSMLQPQERRPVQGRRSVLLSSVIAAATVAILVVVLSAGLLWLRHPKVVAPAPSAPRATRAAPIAVLDMLSASDGWGWNAHLIARTTDGASTFTNATPRGLASDQSVSSFTAVDMHDAWAIITSVTEVSNQLPVFHAELDRTTDGGTTWKRAPINARANPVMFVDALHGWAVVSSVPSNGRLELLRTVDGGATWSLIYETGSTFGCEFSPTFVTRAFGVATFGSCASPTISITVDGGVTWRSVSLPNPARGRGPALITQVYTVNFTSPRSGSVFLTVCPPSLGTCDGVGALYRTADGATWSATTALRVGGSLDMGPSGIAWASDSCVTPCVDNHGIPRPDELLVTVDGGEHWTAEPMPSFARAMKPPSFQFVNSKVGFAVNIFGGHPVGVPETYTYYRTANGGATWVQFAPRLRG